MDQALPGYAADAAAQFDERLGSLCPAAAIRPEVAADEQFLIALAIACSPLNGVLPAPMVEQQARFQLAGHRQTAPEAMRRLALFDGEPAARIAVDWSRPGISHGVDIAVLPRLRPTMIGPAMLRAWTDIADRLGTHCTLEVIADNRARLLYRRLGFIPAPGNDPHGPILSMERAPRTRA